MHGYWYHERFMHFSPFSRLVILLLVVAGLSLPAKTKEKSKKSPKAKTAVQSTKKGSKKKKAEVKAELPVSPPVAETVAVSTPPIGFSRKNKNQLNTLFGIHVVKGSALLTGMQFGHRVSQAPLFLGLEYNFSLYSPGSILGFLAGGWYEMPLEGANGPTLCLGVVAGSGFTTDVIGTPPTVFMGFLDFAFSQPMDDLFDLRVQLRPGYMYKYLAFMMNLSIAFRFA